jgi:hypothetical protein
MDIPRSTPVVASVVAPVVAPVVASVDDFTPTGLQAAATASVNRIAGRSELLAAIGRRTDPVTGLVPGTTMFVVEGDNGAVAGTDGDTATGLVHALLHAVGPAVVLDRLAAAPAVAVVACGNGPACHMLRGLLGVWDGRDGCGLPLVVGVGTGPTLGVARCTQVGAVVEFAGPAQAAAAAVNVPLDVVVCCSQTAATAGLAGPAEQLRAAQALAAAEVFFVAPRARTAGLSQQLVVAGTGRTWAVTADLLRALVGPAGTVHTTATHVVARWFRVLPIKDVAATATAVSHARPARSARPACPETAAAAAGRHRVRCPRETTGP